MLHLPLPDLLAAALSPDNAAGGAGFVHDSWLGMHDTWQFARAILAEHLGTILGFVLAVLVFARLVLEKRNPSNVFAWGLLMLFVPWLGAPLYFLFGGRKSRKLARAKMQVNVFAAQLAAGLPVDTLPDPSAPISLSARRTFAYNSFHLLPDGVAMYETLRHEIARARHSIYVQTFILGRDADARQIVEDLARRAKEGLEVKLLLDALGSLGAAGRFVEPVRRAGGRVARFMPVLPLQTKTSANLRNHRKYAIFDRERVLVGGQNIDRRFTAARDWPGLFADFSALLVGPVAAAFNRAFVSDWCFAAGDSPAKFHELLAFSPESRGPHTIESMTSGPDATGDPLWERLLMLIQGHDKELLIVTPYFVPDDVIFRSMIIQAHAGKRLCLILPETSNHALADFARYHYLRQLHEAGVEILFHRGRMLHAKLVVADRRLAMIGSANLDMRSLFVNFEIGVFLHSPEPVRDLLAWVDQLRPDCVRYAESAHARAGANRRLIEDFAHLLGPLL